MAFKFSYVTIPHSGTRFFNKFFYAVGFRRVTAKAPVTYTPNMPRDYIKYDDDTVRYSLQHFPMNVKPSGTYVDFLGLVESGHPRITVLRDPYLVALSHIETGWGDREFRRLQSHYDYAIYVTTKRKFIFADIDCPTDKRSSHLTSILKQLKVYTTDSEPVIKSYAATWVPIGERQTQYKKEYLQNGILPDGFLWDRLDRARNWYVKAKKECIYDYIA